MDRIFDKLERIQELWRELQLMKPKTIEYEQLMERIRVLSAEYVALIDVPKNPSKRR